MPCDVTLSECFMASQGTKHHLNSVRETHEINGSIMKCCYQPSQTHSVHPASYCRLHHVLPTVRCHEPIKWMHCWETVSVCSHISLNTSEQNKHIMGKPGLCVSVFHSIRSIKINALWENCILCVRIFHSTYSNKVNALWGDRVCVFACFNTVEQSIVNWSILKVFDRISLWSVKLQK